MGSWPQTPVGTFSDFNLEPFEKLRCCAEEPRGFPLTLSKDIMVNGKVLHLESSPPARIFKLGAPACTPAQLLCVRFVWFVSPEIMSGDQFICRTTSPPRRLQPAGRSQKREPSSSLFSGLFGLSAPRVRGRPSSRSWADFLSFPALFVRAAVARHQQRCAPGQSPSLSSLAAAHH